MQIDGDGASWTIENVAGSMAIELPPALGYEVTIQAEGVEPVKLRKVHIAKGSITDLGVVTIRRYPEINGTVVARKDGAPLTGAAVLDGVGKLLAKTDERGHFVFQRRDAALQSISVAYPGYATHVVQIGEGTSDRQLERIQLSDGFTLTVAIKAVPLDGAPPLVKRARLFQTREEVTPTPVLVDEKSVEGRNIEFAGVEAGRYAVELSGDEPLERLVVPVDVAASETIDVAVRPLNISIAAWLGDAIQERTAIDLRALRNLWRVTINTGSSGEYKGRLWQRGLVAANVHLTDGEFHSSRTIDAEYEDAWDIKVPDRRITGSVIDADTRRPVPDTIVQYDFIGDEVAVYGATLAVDKNGAFALFGARSGDYTFKVTAPEHAIPDPVSVSIENGSKERHVEISLKRESSRTVIFQDAATGAPIAEAPVLELRKDGQTIARVLTTDDTGRVPIGVQGKETKTLYILPVSGSIGVAHVAAADGDAPLRVEVPPAASTLHIKMQSAGGAPVQRCRVLLRINGESIPSAVMSFFASLHHVLPHSDTDGDLALPGMPSGLYELWPYRGTAPSAATQAVRTSVDAGASTIVLTFGE